MILQVGVKALIQNDQNELLFLRRNPKIYPGKDLRWDIPGGRINFEENLQDALAREVLEETGLEIDQSSAKLVAAQDIFVPEKDLHVVRLTYYANASGAAQLSDEHTDFAWLTKEQVLAGDLDKYVREVLENEA
jgi:8-oxo-dGTP diphosphatase